MNDRTRGFLAPLLLTVGLSVAAAPAPLEAEDLFQGAARAQAAAEVERLTAIQAVHEDALLALPGVHGVGIGADPLTKEMVFVVTVDSVGKAPVLPLALEGVRLVIQREERPVTMHGGGACIPCHANQVALPVPMGNSTGNPFFCFSCTLGFKACKNGVIYYVTNAHCSPNAQGCEAGAPIGSNTLHRGRLDAPACAITTDIGDVSTSAKPLCGGVNNFADATRVVSANNLTSWSIRDIGTPSTVAGSVLPGDAVRKSGRTTGYTTGTVNSVNYTTTVSGYCCGSAKFVGQIQVNAGVLPFIQGGDSGSALLNMANPPKIVGLLFAGTPNGSQGTANNIHTVLGIFGLTLDSNCPANCGELCHQQQEQCYGSCGVPPAEDCVIRCDFEYEQCLAQCN